MSSINLQTRAISHRNAGWSTIASGVTGILASAALVAFLVYRETNFELALSRLQWHDAGVSIQFLLLIPMTIAFYGLSQQYASGISRLWLNVTIGALFSTSLFLWLAFPKILSDGLYTVPQGVFGVSLVIANWKLSGVIPTALRWFGILIGAGLILVAMFLISYVMLVSWLPLKIPAPTMDEIQKIPYNKVNEFLHYFIWIGSFMGVFTLPFWSILAGIHLLRKRATDSIVL